MFIVDTALNLMKSLSRLDGLRRVRSKVSWGFFVRILEIVWGIFRHVGFLAFYGLFIVLFLMEKREVILKGPSCHLAFNVVGFSILQLGITQLRLG